MYVVLNNLFCVYNAHCEPLLFGANLLGLLPGFPMYQLRGEIQEANSTEHDHL